MTITKLTVRGKGDFPAFVRASNSAPYPSEPLPKGRAALYVLVDPEMQKWPGPFRYIGYTTDCESRYRAHIYESRLGRSRKNNWIASLLDCGRFPIMHSLCELTVEAAKRSEPLLIANLRSAGFDLVNGTDGGDGCHGLDLSTEQRRQISRQLRRPVLAREQRQRVLTRHTEESVRRIVLANKGEANHQAKLTWTIVVEMRRLMESGHTGVEMAERFGISQSQVARIRRNESWVR